MLVRFLRSKLYFAFYLATWHTINEQLAEIFFSSPQSFLDLFAIE
jgi:hypothetical protein